MSAANNLKMLEQLQRALEARPDWAATADRYGVIVEDEWGQKYDLVSAYAIGENTDDPGLVLKIRMHAQHPDSDDGVIIR